jgi:hypothetical protein
MGMCTCCSRERSDAKIRAGLRTLDTSGKSTTKPFHGRCVMIASSGSAESDQLSSAGYSNKSSGRIKKDKSSRSPAQFGDATWWCLSGLSGSSRENLGRRV